MTCRGSRRNTKDKATDIYTDSPEWLAQNIRSSRNFIRKWGHFVQHDALMKPIIPNKFNVGFWIKNCDEKMLETLEPWADNINLLDSPDDLVKKYIEQEQINTIIPLEPKFNRFKDVDVFVKIDRKTFNNEDFRVIQNLSAILDDTGEEGEYSIGNLFINIRKFRTHTNTLINL
jgi:hypothetical protein